MSILGSGDEPLKDRELPRQDCIPDAVDYALWARLVDPLKLLGDSRDFKKLSRLVTSIQAAS
jgi:hypothetical protein